MKQKLFIIFFSAALYSNLFSQLEQNKNFGFNIGIIGAVGTHFQRFGFVFQGYYVYQFAQINASVRVYDNFKTLGPKGEHTEFNGALGICLGYGKTTKETNQFVSSVGNQTGYKNSFAYSYNFWYNSIKTSQVTGTVAFQIEKLSLIFENDLLAKPMLDRFRTGAFLIQYQDKQIQYALNCTVWTGQLGSPVRNDSLFPAKGYLNDENGRYANTSNGLLSGQIKMANSYGQYLQGNVGIDAEQVRNAVQNKAAHTLFKNNYYFPMLASDSTQYLYHKNQKIRKPKLFLNAYTSPDIFY